MKREHIFAHYEQDATRYWKLREGGYATPLSVCQGDEVTFHISNSRSYYDVFVFHEGAKRRLVKEINDLRGGLPPVPEFGYRDGFAWPATVSFQVPRETNTYAAYNCVGGKCLFPYLSTDRSHSNCLHGGNHRVGARPLPERRSGSTDHAQCPGPSGQIVDE